MFVPQYEFRDWKKIGQPIPVHPTVGIDFKVKHIVVNDKRIKLHIWDTGKYLRFMFSAKKRVYWTEWLLSLNFELLAYLLLSQLAKKSSIQLRLHTIEVQKVLLLCMMLQGWAP